MVRGDSSFDFASFFVTEQPGKGRHWLLRGGESGDADGAPEEAHREPLLQLWGEPVKGGAGGERGDGEAPAEGEERGAAVGVGGGNVAR